MHRWKKEHGKLYFAKLKEWQKSLIESIVIFIKGKMILKLPFSKVKNGLYAFLKR